MEREDTRTRKTSKIRWGIALLITILCLVWEGLSCGMKDITFPRIPFQLIGGYLIVTYVEQWITDKDGRARKKQFLYLFLPVFAVIIYAIILPFPYVRSSLFAVLMAFGGYLFWALSLGYLRQEKKKRKICSGLTTAVVVNNIEGRFPPRPGRISPPTYYPVLQYYVAGRQFEQKYQNGLPRPMELDSRIDICYNPQNPEEYQLKDGKKDISITYGIPGFLFVGLILFLVSALAFFYGWGF